MKKLLTIFAALALSGCVVTQMPATIGSPIDEVIEIYGPDYKISELKNGRRAYDWTTTIDNRHTGLVLEKSKTENKKNGWKVTTTESINLGIGGHTYTTSCRYRYKTRFDQKRSAWMVTSIITSGSGC